MRLARALFVFVVAATACTDLSGLAGTEPPADGGTIPTEGGVDAGRDTTVVPPPSTRCDPTKPFGSPELVTQFDPTDNYVKGAIMSADELETFYLRYDSNTNNWDLRHGRRSKITDPWGPIETIGVTPTPDASLSLTAAGLKLYFWEIGNNYRVTRTSTTSPFGTPAKFDVASGPMAFIVASDDTAYFAKIEGDAASDKVIRRATVNTSGFSLTSTPVLDIHVANTFDSNPVLNVSETAMYYASNRVGGKGLADIWVTRRTSKQMEFGPPSHIPELSTDEPDSVSWVSDDECFVFLDRASHVYAAARPK